MDVFFKLHFLFAIPIEPSLVQFIGVFEHYIYKIETDTNLTPATKKKAQAIFSLDDVMLVLLNFFYKYSDSETKDK